jgi:hypothetical protein
MPNHNYPEKVLGTRTVRQGDSLIQQSLIKWKHKSLEDLTWEDNDLLRGQFPDFSLEDKANDKEGGIDGNMIGTTVGLGANGPGPRVWKVYSRRLAKRMKDSDVAKVGKA